VEERAVPKSDVAGETAAPSQPVPAWAAMVPQRITAADAWGATPETREWCRQRIESLRNDGMFTPPGVRGSIAFPGNVGGVNWGSAAWDPVRNVLVANTNRIAAIARVVPREDLQAEMENRKEAELVARGEFALQRGVPYGLHRGWLIAPNGLPCNAPPWGATVAFDLNTGKLRWESPLGVMAAGLPAGSINLGGPLSTAGGLVFTAAAMDPHLHAFDADTGKEIWTAELPASAQATPMTYEWNGKQYVVICAGGHGKIGSKMGDAVVAFAVE
jgi:quinoprotein glucose dehydrogenase